MKHIKEYSDHDDLLKDLKGLGLSLTDDEIQMLKFIEKFGEDKDPEEFADYLYDYEKNPDEFEIDQDSDYYITIEEYCYDIKDFARFNLDGPMRMGTFQRWDEEGIRNSVIYKLYLKMSKHTK